MILFVCFLVCMATLVFASTFEWIMHKYFMHKRWKWLSWPYERHAISHHQSHGRDHFFDAEEWNSAIILLLFPVTFFAVAVGYLSTPWIGLSVWIPAAGYTLAYEFMHYSFHNPQSQWIIKFRWMRYRLECHRLHHYEDSKNYNVVLPWVDRIMGTLAHDVLSVDQSAPEDRRFRGPIHALKP